MDESKLKSSLDDLYDQALVFHGFTPYMRDYELIVYFHGPPLVGIPWSGPRGSRPLPGEYRRYLFRDCVQARVETRLGSSSWKRSLDDALMTPTRVVPMNSSGYVWGLNWQLIDGAIRIVSDSAAAAQWEQEVGITFFEALVGGNAHVLSLVFSDLEVSEVDPGYVVFRIGEIPPDSAPLPLRPD